MAVRFETVIQKFQQHGDKTGWTYFLIPREMAEKIKPGFRRSYRVKGRIDDHPISFVAMIPYGEGDFIIALNAGMRKAISKSKGQKIRVSLAEDLSDFVFSPVFMECLADEPGALRHFNSLAPGHQRYFSNWIDEAKTDATRTKRIARAVSALAKAWGFPEMLRDKTKSWEIR